MSRVMRRWVAALAAFCGATGCGSLDEPTLAPVSRQLLLAKDTTLGVPRVIRDGEIPFADMAASAPSSAGFYFDSTGRFVIRVRDEIDNDRALAAAAGVAARYSITRAGKPGGLSYSVVPAQYTFNQLSQWRDFVFDSLWLRVPEIQTLDLDEVRNRVAIGIPADQLKLATDRVWSLLISRGIDTGAITLDTVRAFSPDAMPVPPATLDAQTSDPLAGGLRIDILHPDNSLHVCSLGFVAQRNGQLGFVTASHCTSGTFGPDNNSGYQLWNRLAGTESVDPYGYTCQLWQECRNSDAAFFASSGLAMRVGTIQRPYGAGSTQIDQNDAYWYVTSEDVGLAAGADIHKVGRTTGWTDGAVLGTCLDVWLDNWHLHKCGYAANYSRGGGDSGGPVFQWDWHACSRCVRLVGIHSGVGAWPDYNAVFSKLPQLKANLGGTWSLFFTPSLPAPTVIGTVVNSRPQLSWNSLPGQNRFDVCRGPGSFQYVKTESGYSSTDFTQVVVSVLPGPPAPGVPHVAYRVVAGSPTDLAPPSNTVYFARPALPQLGVFIEGPTQVKPNVGCYWRANASGGNGVYSYAWKVNGAAVGGNTDLLYYVNGGASFQLSVEITDGVSLPATSIVSVSVASAASTCNLP
ncbi:MAG: hypothetical protein ILNGONEN_01940 [Syntrophorhabdaceae bacterium]|nr:hypothetical protein [Syntrophorhabdaceae bacterium]